MNLNPVVLSIPIFFVLIGLELIVERVRHVNSYRLSDALTNISCGMGQQVTGVFLKVVNLGVYQWVYQYQALWQIPANGWSFWALFIAYDFCYYWAHRLSHEVNLLWSGHVVHHQSEDYNLSVALRQSWFQGTLTFCVYLPLALLGFSTEQLVYVSGLNLLYQFWIHTEAVGRLGWLEWVLNTPSHHRVHHGRNPEYIDKNYAGVFIVWDRLFGTFEPEVAPPVYGITTPFNSWNPVWANFSHFMLIWRQWQQTPGWANRWRLLWAKPGWRPASQGGPLPFPAVERGSYPKFDQPLPIGLARYVLAQYVLTAGLAAAYLFGQAHLTWPLKLAGAGFIGLSIVAGGGLLEGKRWAWWLEAARLVVAGLAGLGYWWGRL
jgi:alkylglycerol monooxygenase